MIDLYGANLAVMNSETLRNITTEHVPQGMEILIREESPTGVVMFTTREDLERAEGPVPYEIQRFMYQVNAR